MTQTPYMTIKKGWSPNKSTHNAEPGDDAKHNHQRSFTTMIIKGGYYYQYFVIEEDEENGDEIEIWERIPKGDPPFEFKEKRFGNIRQVTYEDSQSEPSSKKSPKNSGLGFANLRELRLASCYFANGKPIKSR